MDRIRYRAWIQYGFDIEWPHIHCWYDRKADIRDGSGYVGDAVIKDGLVYASSGYGKGSILLKPNRHTDGKFSVEPVWTSELLDNHHGGVVLADGFLYGAGHEARGWFCLDFKTGDKRWQTRGKGSLTYADGCLYWIAHRLGKEHARMASYDILHSDAFCRCESFGYRKPMQWNSLLLFQNVP